MASVKYRLQKAWPRSHSDPIMPWISEVNCLFTLHRSETIAIILFYIVSISTFDAVVRQSSMWTMAVAQFDLSPLEIFKGLRAQILSPTFMTIPAILQCLVIMCHQEGQKPFLSLFPQQLCFHSKQTAYCDYNIRYHCIAMEILVQIAMQNMCYSTWKLGRTQQWVNDRTDWKKINVGVIASRE